ncbi:unnamed protein product [Adineta steineri]|uniref:Uncharacterized protein n=1 Tax=Adineta steineri TaxID=433720 RepID=A0A814I2I0_9BILA|nr:unnamed protein product [Adineta steineri]CAF1118178.1 unnamed protein product [Adineta steineri]CAF1215358.1 unnamed protein product [Adineta steineri]
MNQTSSSLASNDDLKELCILLDEERYKMHELAEQWKMFGTNTIRKLTCQIVDYQNKLNELEQRQILLVNENQTLKSFIQQIIIKINENKKIQRNVSTQTNVEKRESFRYSCFQKPKPTYDRLIRTKLTNQQKIPIKKSINDPLQQQISIQNMFDAIRTAEVYESIENMTGNANDTEKKLLKEFCNFVWKYLEDRSKPNSSCLL